MKVRLIKAMDSQRNKNRPKLLLDIVKAINSTENKAIGGLKPSEVETPFDNFKLEEKMEERKYQQPHWYLSLIHISEPTRLGMISYAVLCLKK